MGERASLVYKRHTGAVRNEVFFVPQPPLRSLAGDSSQGLAPLVVLWTMANPS